jgi:peptidoglycan/LPS O-acetylase OafA/YrhL
MSDNQEGGSRGSSPFEGYRPGLDGVRAVAVIAVVAYHASGLRLGGLGAAGVTVFFVLSGFLITRLLLVERQSTGAIAWRRFYVRRALRLFPALLVMVTAVTALRWNQDERALLEGARAISYLGDWWAAFSDGMGPLGPTWSLAVEEQFYLVWPAILVLLIAAAGWFGARRGALVLLGAGVLLNALYPWNDNARYMFAHLSVFQAPALLLGCVMAFIRMPRIRGTWIVTVVAIAVLIVVSAHPPTELWHRYADLVYAAAGAALIVAAYHGGPLTLQPLPYLGRLSYSWYLWHAPILYLATSGRFGLDIPMPLAVAVSLAVAAASYHVVERPVLRWRERLGSRRRPDPAQASQVAAA